MFASLADVFGSGSLRVRRAQHPSREGSIQVQNRQKFGRVRLKPDRALLARLRRRFGAAPRAALRASRPCGDDPSRDFIGQPGLNSSLRHCRFLRRGLALRALPAFLKRGLRPRGCQGQALLRAARGVSPVFLRFFVHGRLRRWLRRRSVVQTGRSPSTPPPALTAAPPLIGAGLVGLQQRNPVWKEKANENRSLSNTSPIRLCRVWSRGSGHG